jgi:hypothetical protein
VSSEFDANAINASSVNAPVRMFTRRIVLEG